MYLKKSRNSKTGRVYLTIAHSFYDSKNKTSRTKTIQSLGYLDVLEKEYDDPIAHFTKVAKQMNETHKAENMPISLSIDLKQPLSNKQSPRKNFGYLIFSLLYHFLEIDKFFNNRQRHSNEEFSANSIMKLLVFGRLILPCSKHKIFNEKDMFFDKFDFSLDDIYRCLSLFNKYKEELQLWIHKRICEKLGRNTDLVYYDVTNYFFEIDKEDDLTRIIHRKFKNLLRPFISKTFINFSTYCLVCLQNR